MNFWEEFGMSRSSNPWRRVLLLAVLFSPTPIVAAFPGLVPFFSDRWFGVPSSLIILPLYLLALIVFAQSNSGFAARMER